MCIWFQSTQYTQKCPAFKFLVFFPHLGLFTYSSCNFCKGKLKVNVSNYLPSCGFSYFNKLSLLLHFLVLSLILVRKLMTFCLSTALALILVAQLVTILYHSDYQYCIWNIRSATLELNLNCNISSTYAIAINLRSSQ